MIHLIYSRVMAARSSRDEVLEAVRRVVPGDRLPTMVELAAASGASLRQLYRLFGSREALLRELDRELPADARARILEAAFDLLGRTSLAELNMDDLAGQAGVSRATLYRLFPGKSALFRELITTYSPWEPIASVLESSTASGDAGPAHVMPRVARALQGALAGRSGVLLRMVFEMSRGDPDTNEGIQRSMVRGLPDLIRYLSDQMAAGRLRHMDPVLALQFLAGPIVANEITRPLAALVGSETPREQVVDQVIELWLRAMTPEEPTVNARST